MLIWIILASYYLAACAPGGTTSKNLSCSAWDEVCVTTSTAPSFAKGSPLVVKINVSSTKDYAELYVTIIMHGDVTMDGPQSWETNLSSPTMEPGYTGWGFSIKAGQTRTFTRVLHFPAQAGYDNINIHVGNIGGTIDANADIDVVITNDHAGQVIRAGTPSPKLTSEITQVVYGPGTPVPTYVPATLPWQSIPKPDLTLTLSAPRIATALVSTPMTSMSSYPPPATAYP